MEKRAETRIFADPELTDQHCASVAPIVACVSMIVRLPR
jgi:hypothetical protein